MSESLTELSPPSLVGELLPCITCNRTFLPEALARHQNICQKTAHKKRNVFSSSRQRLQGTGIDPEEVHRSPSPPLRRRSSSRSSWRDKHTQLLNTVRSARGAAPSAAAPAVPSDYEQCPFCARHFGPKAADRHISWCKEQKSRLNTSAASAVAKNRLDARVKYQAPLPLKPRPKRLSVERLSREVSPAVSSVASSAAAPSSSSSVCAARSPTRQTRDYAREYRERASQEREQRLQERKKSPAAVVSSGYGRQPASRLAREGSEPRATSPSKEAFRRTQSFRTRPAGTRATNLKHQRTTDSLSVRPAGSMKQRHQHQHQHQHHHHQQQQRDEPDGGEDVPSDRPGYHRSTSTPAEGGGGGGGSSQTHTRLSPSRQSRTVPALSPSPPLPPPPAGYDGQQDEEEAYITRSQLDEYQRIGDAVVQDAGYDPYATAERQLEELLGHAGSPSPPAKPSPGPTNHRSPPPAAAPATAAAAPAGSPPMSASAPAPARSPSPGRSAFAKIERPHSALFPLRDDVLKPTALSPRKDPIAEAISILNEYAIQQRSAADEPPPSPPSSVESSQTVINRYDFVSSAIASYRENAENMPPPPDPEPVSEPESDGPPTNASFPTNHGSRRFSGAPTGAETPPPADGAQTPPRQHQQQQRGWSEPPWRPIDDSAPSSNRSSVERNGGGGFHQPQLSGLSPAGEDRDMSPSDSLYETEMPDFDLIMEQARRASERKNSALSPRKARMRGLDMCEMMGIEVSELNMKNGGGGSGTTTPRFCHECGSQYPVQAARFCCQCGAQKLCL